MDVEADMGWTSERRRGDLDDDIIPGCYMLGIIFKGFPYSRILDSRRLHTGIQPPAGLL